MSPKFAAALAVLALQALCIQASSIGVADDDNNLLDVSVKLGDILDIDLPGLDIKLGDLGVKIGDLDLTLGEKTVAKTKDIGVGILEAVQRILNAVNTQIQNAYTALLGAITTAVQNAQKVTQEAVDTWDKNLQNIIDGAHAVNSTIVACQAEQPSMQTVAEGLNADVKICVETAVASAQVALKRLEELRPQVDNVMSDVRQAVVDCQPSGLMAGACLIGRAGPLLVEAAGVVGNATRLGAEVTGQLAVAIPVQVAGCVGTAVTTRGAQAAAITEAIRHCIASGLNPIN